MVKKDINQALSYYKHASELGSSQAYLILGMLYESGKHVSKNSKLAVEYLQKASKLGNQ